jgi:hypothetical protein
MATNLGRVTRVSRRVEQEEHAEIVKEGERMDLVHCGGDGARRKSDPCDSDEQQKLKKVSGPNFERRSGGVCPSPHHPPHHTTLPTAAPIAGGELLKGESPDERAGPMNADAELWNGRLAMLGIVALAATEYHTGAPFVDVALAGRDI